MNSIDICCVFGDNQVNEHMIKMAKVFGLLHTEIEMCVDWNLSQLGCPDVLWWTSLQDVEHSHLWSHFGSFWDLWAFHCPGVSGVPGFFPYSNLVATWLLWVIFQTLPDIPKRCSHPALYGAGGCWNASLPWSSSLAPTSRRCPSWLRYDGVDPWKSGDFQRPQLGKSWLTYLNLWDFFEDFNLECHLPKKISGFFFQIFRHPEIQTIWLVDFLSQSGCLATAVFRICPGPMWHKTHHFNGFRCWCLSPHNVMPRVSLIFLAKRLDVWVFSCFFSKCTSRVRVFVRVRCGSLWWTKCVKSWGLDTQKGWNRSAFPTNYQQTPDIFQHP